MQAAQKNTNPPQSANTFTQPDLFERPLPDVIAVSQWAVADAMALLDARQREMDERRFGSEGRHADAATLSLFDET